MNSQRTSFTAKQRLSGSRARRLFFWPLFVSLLGIPLAAQDLSTRIELSPQYPSASDCITFKLSGIWRNGCVPQSPKVSISSAVILIGTSNPGAICTEALTPWTLTGSIGKLAAGNYDLIVQYSGPSIPSTVEIGRKSFTVAESSTLNEAVLPIVVNGAFAEKLHYQTIFTILNTSTQEIQATLQVYSNAGAPGGVFCSPLAPPPPSSAIVTLKPNAEYLQFTSADLPFHNGWAHLHWEGPASILAAEEVTLVAAPPSPCQLICNRPSTEKLSSTQTPSIKPARDFRLPVTINSYRQTALALVNPSCTDAVNVKISILDAFGEIAKLGPPTQFEIKIRPLERISKYLWQMAVEHSILTVIFPVPEMFQGSVILTADAPFAAGALNIMFPEGKFVSIPSLSPIP